MFTTSSNEIFSSSVLLDSTYYWHEEEIHCPALLIGHKTFQYLPMSLKMNKKWYICPSHVMTPICPSKLWLQHVCKVRMMIATNNKLKYSSVFRENRCPPPPKPVYGGNFSHEAVTSKIRSTSNKLLILSDLYRLVNLVTFHPMVHEITCRQTLFGLIFVD